MRDVDPVSNVRFFKGWDNNKSQNRKREDISEMLPVHFSEYHVWCVSKDPAKSKAIVTGWNEFVKKDLVDAKPTEIFTISADSTPASGQKAQKTYSMKNKASGSPIKRTRLDEEFN
jgi:hypothetical protein